jgi:hypothetical protein
MRIRVTGDSESARAVAAGLMDGGFVVDDQAFDYTVDIGDTEGSQIVVDGIDCPLELHLFNAISLLSGMGVFMDRPGPNRNDAAITIWIPIDLPKDKRVAVERGVRGGFENMLRDKPLRPAQPTGFPVADAIRDVVGLYLEAERNRPRWWQVWR